MSTRLKNLSVLCGLLLITSPALAVQYFVRTDGNDACNGKKNAGGASGVCAFRTVDKGINSISAGDTLQIAAGTYVGAVKRVKPLTASAKSPAVIQGDQAAARTDVIIDGNGTASAVEFSALHQYVTVRHLTIRNAATTLLNFSLNGNNDHLTVEDVHFDDNPGTLKGRQGRPRAFALRFYASNSMIQDNYFDGDRSGTRGRSGMTASDAGFMFAAGWRNLIQRNEGHYFLGSAVQENGSNTIIQDNIFDATEGDSDDGVIQIYNDEDVIVRRNLFLQQCPTLYGVVVQRTSQSSEAHGHCGDDRASSLVYNNTFTLHASCAAGTLRMAIRKQSKACEEDNPAGDIVFINNLVSGEFGRADGDYGAIEYGNAPAEDDCPDAPPYGVRLDHNLFFNARVSGSRMDEANCHMYVKAGTGDVIGKDPLLDSGFAPRAGSPACGAGATDYKAWDGDVPKPWIGALKGACPAAEAASGSPKGFVTNE